ncbi:MAG: c-type cytochrome [Arenibacterium sp.]
MRRCLFVLLLALWPGTLMAQEFFTLKGHGGPIMGIAVAPDGQIATASFDNALGLWDGATPQWLDGHGAAVNTVIFDGPQLFSGSDDFTLRRWPGGEVVGEHLGKVMALAALKNEIAAASWDGTIGLWPRAGGTPRYLTGHQAGVNALAVSGDGASLFSASSDGTIREWDLATAAEKIQLVRHGFGINELVIHPDAGWLAYGAVDGVTRIIDIATGNQIADFTLERRPVLALALNPDKSRLAVGDGEGYIMVIDTENWQIARDFRATLRGPVWALAFSNDGANIHAGGLDSAMYSWPLASLDAHGQMGNATPSFLRAPAEMENGERQFARKCSICHTLTPSSARRAGPTLYQLFGRPAGTVSDYRYSDILDGSEIVWDDETVDALFDVGPDHFIPGSKMPMQRITDPQDRADLIAYLKRATKGAP